MVQKQLAVSISLKWLQIKKEPHLLSRAEFILKCSDFLLSIRKCCFYIKNFMHFNLLTSLKDISDCKDHPGHWLSRPISRSSESQSARRGALQAVSQRARRDARKPDCQPASSANAAIKRRTSVTKKSSTRSPSRRGIIILLDHQFSSSQQKTLVY